MSLPPLVLRRSKCHSSATPLHFAEGEAIDASAEIGRLWLPDVGEELGFPREDVVSELVLLTGDPRRDGHDDVLDACAIAAQVHAKRIIPARQPQKVFEVLPPGRRGFGW